MSKIESVLTDKAPKPLPQFSQAIKYNGLVYCSGNIGLHPATSIAVEGTVKDRTVCLPFTYAIATTTPHSKKMRKCHCGTPYDLFTSPFERLFNIKVL